MRLRCVAGGGNLLYITWNCRVWWDKFARLCCGYVMYSVAWEVITMTGVYNGPIEVALYAISLMNVL